MKNPKKKTIFENMGEIFTKVIPLKHYFLQMNYSCAIYFFITKCMESKRIFNKIDEKFIYKNVWIE